VSGSAAVFLPSLASFFFFFPLLLLFFCLELVTPPSPRLTSPAFSSPSSFHPHLRSSDPPQKTSRHPTENNPSSSHLPPTPPSVGKNSPLRKLHFRSLKQISPARLCVFGSVGSPIPSFPVHGMLWYFSDHWLASGSSLLHDTAT